MTTARQNDAATSVDADVVILGGGMAGCTAAATLANEGHTVALIDKADALGGSAVLSGGYLWTAADRAVLADEAPLGDPELVDVVLDGYGDAVDWIDSLGVEVSSLTPVLRFGRGVQFDVLTYVQRCKTLVDAAGGIVAPSTVTHRVLVDAGRAAGVAATDRDGEVEVHARWVVLATGGFQADARLRERHIGPSARDMLVRSNPHSSGDGLQLATAAGASMSHETGGFYGHLIGAPVTDWRPERFALLAQGQSEYCVLVDRSGQRFTDESLGDHVNNQAVLQRPGSVALLLADETLRREVGAMTYGPSRTRADKFAVAAESGARVASADSWKKLAVEVGEWGFDRGMADTIEAYNDAIVTERAISPGRIRHRRPLNDPPFYAMEVVPAITASHGGLRVDRHARVLGDDGRPIPGLLAAGADAGGIYGLGYAGGLALAATFAQAAARTILDEPALDGSAP